MSFYINMLKLLQNVCFVDFFYSFAHAACYNVCISTANRDLIMLWRATRSLVFMGILFLRVGELEVQECNSRQLAVVSFLSSRVAGWGLCFGNRILQYGHETCS